jgi:ribonuclease Z
VVRALLTWSSECSRSYGDGRTPDAGEFAIKCFPVRHRDTDSFAFTLEATRTAAPAIRAVGSAPCPERTSARGVGCRTTGAIADGRTIDPEDVLGPFARGAKLVIVGDTETTDELSRHLRDADLLVIEATFLERDAAMASEYGHLTAAKAAGLAASAGVKQLVLTHISGRYGTRKSWPRRPRSSPRHGSRRISIESRSKTFRGCQSFNTVRRTYICSLVSRIAACRYK